MLIAQPIHESYDEIKRKYDGYCVLVVDCENERQNFGTGKVLAYHEKLAELTRETIDMLNDDMGIFAYKTFTNLGNISPIQVIHHE